MLLVAHIIEKEREKAFAEGRELGRKEGRKRAIAEGRAEAYEDVDRQMKPYYERMRAALDTGEPFNEPPPRFRRNGR